GSGPPFYAFPSAASSRSRRRATQIAPGATSWPVSGGSRYHDPIFDGIRALTGFLFRLLLAAMVRGRAEPIDDPCSNECPLSELFEKNALALAPLIPVPPQYPRRSLRYLSPLEPVEHCYCRLRFARVERNGRFLSDGRRITTRPKGSSACSHIHA